MAKKKYKRLAYKFGLGEEDITGDMSESPQNNSNDKNDKDSNALSTIGTIANNAGMFDSLAAGINFGQASNRSGVSEQPTVITEGVLGAQSGSHLGHMWSTRGKTNAAIQYVHSQGNYNYAPGDTNSLLNQRDSIGTMKKSNINTNGQGLIDFVFDPLSFGLTTVLGLRESSKKRQKRINKAIDDVNERRERNFENAVEVSRERQMGNMLSRYAAFGGNLFQIDGPASYDVAKDNVFSKERGSYSKNGITFNPAFNSVASEFDEGGMLRSGNFTNGVTIIDNGGTHENNPHEGVQIGIAPDGIPNLVEEGEAIYNDYVFSNRLKVPKEVRNKYKLRGPKDMTFADAFKEAQKESEERENDPISKNGLDNIAMILARTQEAVRGYEKAHKKACGGNLFPYGGFDLKYAPVVVAGGAVLSDALGLTNKDTNYNFIPDYRELSYSPLGEYVTPTRFDIRDAENKSNQKYAALMSALRDNSSPSTDNALIAAAYNNQIAGGDLLMKEALDQYNRDLKALEFNRQTNQLNNELGIRVGAANNDGRLATARAKLAEAMENTRVSDLVTQGRWGNLSNLAEGLATIGKDAETLEAVRKTIESLGRGLSDEQKELYGITACGGRIKRRKRGLTY